MDIYKITAGDYYYYGQTIGKAKCRWSKHKSSFRRGKKGNPILTNIWKKHGEEVFSMEVVFSCDDKELLDLVEEEFIDKHFDDPYCANISRFAVKPPSRLGTTLPAKSRLAFCKPIVCNGKVYPSQVALSKELGVTEQTIYRWLTGRRRVPKNIKVSYHRKEK